MTIGLLFTSSRGSGGDRGEKPRVISTLKLRAHDFGFMISGEKIVPSFLVERRSSPVMRKVGGGKEGREEKMNVRDVNRAMLGRHGPSNLKPMAGLGRARAEPEEH
ncbi:hypothetical protein L484_014064 [Morus notabilis]|uniref:Uncharacterized protein n=1 Tax=Morus notabilis TaxID=981085 RepID=W9QN83_9ROSA|nr:hypothetical protein L484_014064 [Morus notabilis]